MGPFYRAPGALARGEMRRELPEVREAEAFAASPAGLTRGSTLKSGSCIKERVDGRVKPGPGVVFQSERRSGAD
ncbi:MAG: hypothetical protein ACLP1D_06545, partial [Xanthobacteraceae bacterium]